MEHIIREYKEQDRNRLKKLLFINSENKSLLNMLGGFKAAYSAFVENKLVGFVATWTNKFHPYCTYFCIVSEPNFNVEEKLLDKVEQELDYLPLQASIWENTAHLKNFYEDNGFKEIRKTYMPRLKTFDAKMSNNNNRLKLKTLTEILPYESLMENLTQLVKFNYKKAHTANPVADMGSKKWRELLLSNDIVSDGSYLFADEMEKEIIAYSFLHDSDEKNKFELGWCGATSIQNKKLLSSLVNYQMNYCNKHNVSFLIGEFDTTDIYAMEVYKSFPFDPCPALITYQK